MPTIPCTSRPRSWAYRRWGKSMTPAVNFGICTRVTRKQQMLEAGFKEDVDGKRRFAEQNTMDRASTWSQAYGPVTQSVFELGLARNAVPLWKHAGPGGKWPRTHGLCGTQPERRAKPDSNQVLQERHLRSTSSINALMLYAPGQKMASSCGRGFPSRPARYLPWSSSSASLRCLHANF